MKKILALLLSLILALSLVPAASAETDSLVLNTRDADLNKWSDTVSLQDDSGYYMLISVNGDVLVPISEGYTAMSSTSSYPFFKVEKDVADGLHRKGLIDGTGKLLVPTKYADVNIISERWQAGVLLIPSGADDKDYTVTNYNTDEKSFYRIDLVDFYLDGAYVGSLSRSEYGDGYVTAYGAYITLKNKAGERTFYNQAMEPSPYESSYTGEFDSVYKNGSTTYYHQGTGQIAFTPECTLDPADLENPYLYDHGVVYNIRGEALFETKAYDYVRSFNGGYAVATMGSKKGLLSVNSGELIPAEYDDLGNYEDEPLRFGYISAIKDGKFGFLDAQGRETIPFTYSQDVVRNYTDFATIKDLDGTIIVLTAAAGQLPVRFSEVSFPSSYGCMSFVGKNTDGQTAVYDLYGTELLPFSDAYRNIELTVDGTAGLVYSGSRQYTLFRFDIAAPETAGPAETAATAEEDGWTCKNGHSGNQGNFCSECGSPRPEEHDHHCIWCGYDFGDTNPSFCPNCGKPVNP